MIRTLFARRDDPYAGNDVDNARRLGGLAWLMYGTAALILLPFDSPRAWYEEIGWVIAVAIVVHALATGYRWLKRPRPGFDGLLAGSYVAVAGLAILQALAGEDAQAYQELYLLIAVYTAAVHPPRRVAPFLLVLCVTASLPFLYSGWTSADAADFGVRLLMWLGLSALAMVLLATLRAQRQALADESAHSYELARQDSLTGLGNRRRLMQDLEEGLLEANGTSLVVAIFDLDGFKAYNDVYGHATGDTLLRRLGAKLSDVIDAWPQPASAYRMGGDEFCVLAHADAHDPAAVVEAAAGALSEQGEGFAVDCSYGWVLLPDRDASTPSAALRLADRRMYAQKNLGRTSAGRQTTDVLVRVLAERSAELGMHMEGVAALCDHVARRLGVSVDRLGPIVQAASLHDIGKAAIPDAILGKPAPLSESEWAFMRTHTLIGERILAAAPALHEASRLVRSSHERFDGSGYPDGLAGESIPLGARVIAVCDAFDAMTSDRPYRERMTEEQALAELRRGAGRQFDPSVVEAFTAAIAEREIAA